MDNFNARYEKELAYQEITSNKYTLYGILLFIGVELLISILRLLIGITLYFIFFRNFRHCDIVLG